MEKITVIVPVYKVEKYLNKCVESIVTQTYSNIEIILVDDGSPDNCPKICDEWAEKDNRIKVIHKKNGGLSEARNVGIKKATGDYISFVDSDDIISVNMYKNMMNLMIKNNADIVTCEFARFMDGEKPKFKNESNFKIYNSQDSLKKLLTEKISNHVCNKLFKKQLFCGIEFPTGRNYEDIMVMYKLILKIKKLITCNGLYYGYMSRENSITHCCSKKSIEDYIDSINTRYNDLIFDSKLYEYLTASKMREIYICHLKATIAMNKSLFFSDLLNREHIFLKKSLNIKTSIKYLGNDNLKTKILKLILVYNKNLFWIIRLKNRKGECRNDKK